MTTVTAHLRRNTVFVIASVNAKGMVTITEADANDQVVARHHSAVPPPAEAKGEGELPTTDAEVEADNAKAADRARLLAITNGYVWDGAAWVKPPTPQPADGEAVAPFGWAVFDEAGRYMTTALTEKRRDALLDSQDAVLPQWTAQALYTTPPAPVQAAPQEGEVYQPIRFGGIRRPSHEALAAAFWEHRQRENSLPADLCDSKLLKFGNDIVRRARELAPYLAAHPSACELGADGVGLIAAERQRQISAEGWTPEHDDEHGVGELATAAACYAAPDLCRSEDESPTKPRVAILAHWPWALSWWKPGDRIRELAKAGALIAAEIDRLQRAALQHRGDSQEVGRG